VARKYLEEVVAMCKSRGLKVSSTLLENRSAVEAIVNYAAAQKIDLVVIGTRGLSGFKKLLLGNVSAGVVNHAHCQVLVVR
jgi:nucleotide-binding universal stress UspA family protein